MRRDLLLRCRTWPLAPPGGTAAQRAEFAASTLTGAEWTDLGDVAAARVALPWDGALLGVSCARLALVIPPGGAAKDLIRAARDEAGRAGVDYLVTRVDAAELSTVQALEDAGFRLVDTIFSQHLAVASAPVPANAAEGYSVRAAVETDAGALEALSDTCFDDTRFHVDAWVGPARARAVYRAWAAACARGRNEVCSVAVAPDGEVVGFLSARDLPAARAAYRVGHARVELVAVAPGHRGKRLVDAMTTPLLAAAATHSWDVVGIGTQVGNLRAIRAYRRLGFLPGDAVFTLRWLRGA